MSTSYTYRLPWPPSVNVYWRTGTSRKGVPVTYLSARAKEFRKAVEQVVLGRLHEECSNTLTGRLAVNIELTAPSRRKFDVDNFCKSTLDALMHAGVFADDEQIDELRVKRLHVEPPGCCDVTITEIS